MKDQFEHKLLRIFGITDKYEQAAYIDEADKRADEILKNSTLLRVMVKYNMLNGLLVVAAVFVVGNLLMRIIG